MPHNLCNMRFGFFHRSKHESTAPTSADSVAKYWLCVATRRASFHTRSIGASCGLYGGKNSNPVTRRFFFRKVASFNAGSFVSGGIHIRSRVPCCWKWHSSRLHRSISFFLAKRRSFFKSFDFKGISLGYLGPRLTHTKSKLTEQPFALPYAQTDVILPFQMFTEHFAIPEVLLVSEITRAFPKRSGYIRPLFIIELGWTPRMISLANAIKPRCFKSADPTLNCSASTPDH